MGHVVGGVRTQETPIEDRNARLGDRDEAPADEGAAERVSRAIYIPILRHPIVPLTIVPRVP